MTTYEYRTFDGGVTQREAFLNAAAKEGLEYVEGLAARDVGHGSYRVLFRRATVLGHGPGVAVCVNGKCIAHVPLTGLSQEYPNAVDVCLVGVADAITSFRRFEVPPTPR